MAGVGAHMFNEASWENNISLLDVIGSFEEGTNVLTALRPDGSFKYIPVHGREVAECYAFSVARAFCDDQRCLILFNDEILLGIEEGGWGRAEARAAVSAALRSSLCKDEAI